VVSFATVLAVVAALAVVVVAEFYDVVAVAMVSLLTAALLFEAYAATVA